MTKNIPVKIGWDLFIILSIPLFIIIRDLLTHPTITSGIFVVAFVLFLLISLLGIRYQITNDMLEIKNGIFGTTQIKIHEITKIEKTWNAISSPAPSLFGRVEIYFGNQSIVISPKNFEEFKTELLKINPKIEVKQ